MSNTSSDPPVSSPPEAEPVYVHMRHQGGYQRKTACGRWQAGGIVDAWEAERVTCPACREAIAPIGEAEADVESNTSSNDPLPSGASSPGPAARPYRKFNVYSAGWDGDPETLGMRCWVCGVSREFGADPEAVGLEELTAWAEAHRCPGLIVATMTEETE